jgi:hypothetical protein
MVFDGPDRAYFFELNSAQALVLDLAEFAIVRSIALQDVLLESELNFLSDTGFRRLGNRLVTSVYGTSADFLRASSQSKLLIFDPESGGFEVKDTPCGGLNYSVVAPGGDIYFSTDPYIASVHWTDAENAPAPCMVRLSQSSGEFSAQRVALNDLTGGPTGGLVPGPDGSAWLRVLDTSVYSAGPGSSYLEAFSAPTWRTWSIDLSDSPRAEPIERAPLAGGIRVFEIDGNAYENESSADFASTTLIKTTDAASARGLSMPGVAWGIVRVR